MTDQPTPPPEAPGKTWSNTGHAVACTEHRCVNHCPRRRRVPTVTDALTPHENGWEDPR